MQTTSNAAARVWCKDRYLKLWSRLGAGKRQYAEKFWDELEQGYGRDNRHYHNFAHICFCLRALDEFEYLAEARTMVEIALFYHDVVYDVREPGAQNEEKSVEVALNFLKKNGQLGAATPIRSLILATKHDHAVIGNDERLIVDIDLLSLAVSWPVFLENNRDIRQEYAHISEEVFRKVNSAFLKKLLDRTPTYYHPAIEGRYGAQARENLSRCLNLA